MKYSFRKCIGALALSAFCSTATADVITLQPQADAYVRNSNVTAASTTNYGADPSLVSNNANGVRIFFVRFDLSGITAPITNLKLQLTSTISGTAQGFNVYGLASGTQEAWVESSITWANAPGVINSYVTATGTLAQTLDTADLYNAGEVVASFTNLATVGSTDTLFDVSSGPIFTFLNADADKVVTFMVAEQDPVDTSGIAWGSKESTGLKPTLTVTTQSTPTPTEGAPVLRVVLVSGQSNADGRAVGSGLPANLAAPQANVQYYSYTHGSAANGDGTLGTLMTLRPGGTQMPAGGFGPEVTLGYNLAPLIEQQPNTKLAIIKYAKGGSSLNTDWKAGGDATTTGDGTYYQTFQTVVRNGLAKLRSANPGTNVSLAGMIWVQGETDIDNGAAAVTAYAANLTTFISDVRQTFCPTLPFFFSRISSQQTVYSAPADPDYPNYLTIRDQQAQVAANVQNTYLIDTDSTAFTMNGDNLHFNTGGQQAMGEAFAKQMGPVLQLKVSAIEPQPTGIRLRWNGVTSKRYRIAQSGNLTLWTSQTVGMVSEWTDSAAGSGKFYRVEELDDTLP